MTKEMYEKCLNKDMVIFGKLHKDVQDAIKTSKSVQFVSSEMEWCGKHNPNFWSNSVYRIDPLTPYDPEFEEKGVIFTSNGLHGVDFGQYFTCSCAIALCHPNCLGIIYEKDGVETLRTSVDLAFGTPKRVRFAK